MESNFEQQFQKIEEEIKELRSKYSTVSEDIQTLKSSQDGIQENIGTLCGNLEKMNKNVEDMISKLNTVSDEQQKSTVEKMMNKKGGLVSAMIKTPLRKLVVGSVGLLMTVGDYTSEKLSNAKEGMEDIVAEAQYNRKGRHTQTNEG